MLIFIYKISNNINDKVYIGQTIRPIEDRFRRHINDAINNNLDTHFARAIRKYGEDKFYIEQIDSAETQEELNKKEQYWIRYYDSIHNGYNETDALYKSGGNTYCSKTDEELENIKLKISLSKYGELNPNSKSVKCLNIKTNEELIFKTVEECKKYFNEKHHRFITTRINHQTHSLYKNEWNISYVEDEYEDLPEKTNKHGIDVKVVNLITNETMFYKSIRQTSRECKVNRNILQKELKLHSEVTIDNYYFTILN